MPELPEVETVVRSLRPLLIGRVIVAMRSDWLGHIVQPSLDEMQARIAGRQVVSINRRGKYLVFELTNHEFLIIHLKMTGHLAVTPPHAEDDPYVHTTFELKGGDQLRFRDVRKFGRVYLVHDPAQILGRLGPEPLSDEFTPTVLAERINPRRRVIKPLLLDQSFVAGIGNIYADEALFGARIRPERRSDTLTEPEIRALYDSIQAVLRLGIAREGASIDSYVKPDGEKGDMQDAVAVFRRTGLPCYTCGTAIERIVLGGRSTHFCPSCQV